MSHTLFPFLAGISSGKRRRTHTRGAALPSPVRGGAGGGVLTCGHASSNRVRNYLLMPDNTLRVHEGWKK
jgi:hypothetical protein